MLPDCSVRLDELLWLYSTLLKLRLARRVHARLPTGASLKVSASVAVVVSVTVVVSVKLPQSLSEGLSLMPRKTRSCWSWANPSMPRCLALSRLRVAGAAAVGQVARRRHGLADAVRLLGVDTAAVTRRRGVDREGRAAVGVAAPPAHTPAAASLPTVMLLVPLSVPVMLPVRCLTTRHSPSALRAHRLHQSSVVSVIPSRSILNSFIHPCSVAISS